jgi:cytochrome c oxidase cbb3-type subunit 4
MDALVAYLQMLGTLVDFSTYDEAPATAEEEQMETYTAMRLFADSWGLLCMALFFVGAVIFAFRPGAKRRADEAAQIPFKEE